MRARGARGARVGERFGEKENLRVWTLESGSAKERARSKLQESKFARGGLQERGRSSNLVFYFLGIVFKLFKNENLFFFSQCCILVC